MLFSFDCRKWLGSTSQKPRRRKRFRLLSFELLEQRITPTTVTWINPAGGNWDTGANWSSGAVPGAGDDAVINVAANVTITHSNNVTDSVNSVTASDPITLSGGTLSVATTFSDSSSVTLSGGTMANAQIQAGTIFSASTDTTNTFQNVTLGGTLDMSQGLSTVTIVNGLTLNGTLKIDGASRLLFSGSGNQTLSTTASGTISFGADGQSGMGPTGAGTTLVIGQGITVEGASGDIGNTFNTSGGSVTNNGVIDANASAGGGAFLISATTWTNAGTIEATSGNTIELGGTSTASAPAWINDAGATITTTGGTIDLGGSGTLPSSGPGLGSNWLNQGVISESAGTITLASPVSNASDTFTLPALGTLTRLGGASDGTLNLQGTVVNTSSTLVLDGNAASSSSNGTTFTLPGALVLVSGCTIEGGTVQTQNSATLIGDYGLGARTLAGGVTLDGTLDLSLNLSAVIVTGGLTLNGTIKIDNDSLLLFSGSGNQTLSTTTAGTVSFGTAAGLGPSGAGTTLVIGQGITVEGASGDIGNTFDASGGNVINNGVIDANASAGGGAFLISATTWTNAGTIEATSGNTIELGGTSTASAPAWINDAGATITTTGGTIDLGGSGTLPSSGPGLGSNWLNQGVISESAGTITLASPVSNASDTFTLPALGTLTRLGGASDGTLNLQGTVVNTSSTLVLDGNAASSSSSNGTTFTLPGALVLVSGCTIEGGTVQTQNSATLIGDYGLGARTLAGGVTLDGTLDLSLNLSAVIVTGGLTLNGTIKIDNDSLLLFSGSGNQTLSTTTAGTVSFGTAAGLGPSGAGTTLVIGQGITVEGASGDIGNTFDASGGNVINNGVIDADTAGGYFALDATNWTNMGAIEAVNGGTAILGPVGKAGGGIITNLGTITGVSGFVFLSDTLNNAGSNLVLNATTGSLDITFGTISGGTVTTTGGAELVGSNDGGFLSGVTLAGTLDLTSSSFTSAHVTIENGLTLSQGSINLAGFRRLIFQGTQDLSGTGTVSLNNMEASGGLLVPNSGDTLTILPGITVQGSSGVVGSSGGGLISNQGTIEADGGGTLIVQGYTNFAGSTLTGGTWEAIGNSTLRLVGANITTNAASILLDGASSQIDSGSTGTTNALAGFTTNAAAGSFTIQNGADFTSAPAFTNSGTLSINGGGTFVPGGAGVYTQTGGTTILNAGTLGTSGNQINIQGGTLSGPGTVNANLTNAGEVDLGSNPGTLTVKGNFTQTAAGALALEVGGATAGSLFDQVKITGTASLNGTLNVALINGYAPGLEETYDVLNFASASGSFATFNSPQINGNPAFATTATPTSFELLGATSAPNLAVSSIAFTPANPLLNQNVTVTFTVTNLGTVATTAGSWTDSVYLSTEAVVDGNAVLLGRVMHTGDLASQAQYFATLTAPVPGLAVGSYHVIVVVDSGLQVPDINRANGTGVAPTELSTQPPTLTVGTSISGTIANGQDLYYRLNVAPGTSVVLGATFAVAVESEMYVLLGALPTDGNMGLSSGNLDNLQPQLQLPTGQGGAYYIWLHGREGAATSQSFTLRANLETFEVDSFNESSGSNTGPVTMELTGAGFTAETAVSLHDGSTVLPAATTTFINADDLSVTFNLANAPAGSYTVQAVDGGQSATAPGTFQITAQGTSQGASDLKWFETAEPPAVSLQGAEFLTAGVKNVGTTDAQVPPFVITSAGLYNGGGEQTSAGGQTNVFSTTTAVNFLYPGGTLAPGQSVGTSDAGQPTSLNGGYISLDGVSPDSSLVLEAETPFGVPTPAWDAIVNNFLTDVGGETVTDSQKAYQADAIYLAQVGDPVSDPGALFTFEILKASDSLPTSTLTSVVDSQSTEPGLPLNFARTFNSSLVGRYTLGDLGYGWTSNWDISATTDPSTENVYIQEGSITRNFKALANGKYQGANGDQGILTQTQGSYSLLDSNDITTTFLSNGKLNYLQDRNGNRITAGYTGALMTSLTASDGDQLTIAFNAQGLISQITDPAGNVTTYGYDSNEQLISVSNASGTYRYLYINGQGAALEHDLAVIAYPDGTHTIFSYDSKGRLTEQSGDNGTNAVTYAYLSPGGYTATSATGAATTFLYDVNGLVAVVKDPLGNVSQVTYNADGQPVFTSYPGGSAVSTTYDSKGNITTQTDPLGNVTNYTINTLGQLQSLGDPNGNTTSFSYTAQESLASITQPDGTAASYVYNAQGDVSKSIDALGRVTNYTYDSHGRLILRQNPDGTSIAYGYDTNGDLTSVTDASGAIMMTYDAAHNLTLITYPNGQFLAYTYNAGEQLAQMTDQTGFTEDYTYTAAGQLSGVTDGNGGLIVSYSYDLDGRLAGQVNGNGTYTTYTYALGGQIGDLTNFAPDGTVNSSFAYSFNALGQVTSMITSAGTTTYTYDADGQLASAKLSTGELITYAYDADGNRTVVSDSGATTTYTTNNTNEYTSVGGVTYGYDLNGNLTMTTGGPGGNTTYTYDDENRLIGEKTPTDIYTYQYDALGNLIASTDSGKIVHYLINPLGDGSVAAEYDGSGNLIANFTYGVGLISQVAATGTAEFYDYDALGSTAGLSGPSGNYVANYTYLPFGQIQSMTGTAANPFQYIGKSGVMTLGGGLDYMRARFYSPATGRFINRDPSGLAGGHNLYAYAGNNPVSCADPTGLIFYEMMTPAQQAFISELAANCVASVADQAARFGSGATEEFLANEEAAIAENLSQSTFQNEINNGLITVSWAAPEEIPIVEEAIPIVEEAVVDNEQTLVDGTLALAFAQTVIAAAPVATSTLAGLGPVAALVIGAVGEVLLPLTIVAATGFLIYEVYEYYNEPSIPTGPSPGVVPGKATFTVFASGAPRDPNFISGPGGYGAQAFIPQGVSIPYIIGFENDATATAPAQSVTLTQQLDPNLDWSTFQLGDFSFGGTLYEVPAGLTSYSTRIDATGSVGVYVDVDVDFDELNGVLTWNFTSIDPTTLGQPVGNFQEGFLPPDVTFPEGDGFITYTIQPKTTDTTGAVINAQATVYFNPGLVNGSSLATASTLNTIDAGAPTSSVTALPAFSPASFTVNWSGLDDSGGSGIAYYNVYASDDDGPFTLWQSATTQTSAIYTGQGGHTYGFYSVATDNVGNTQPTPAAAQATTAVDAVPPTSSVLSLPAFENPASFAISWSGSDNAGGSGIASYTIYDSDNGGSFTPFLTNTTKTLATFTGQAGHTYGFFSVATDVAGNVQPTPTSAQATTTVANDNGMISGFVFHDYNANGQHDSAEPGLAGVTVYLDLNDNGVLDTGEPTATTNASGAYDFTGLAPGTYVVRQILLGGVILSTPPKDSYSLTVTNGSNFINQNFADVLTSITVPLTLPPNTAFPAQGNANADYVEAIYRAVLDRNADPGGLSSWTGHLNDGSYTRLQVVQGIRNSPEHFGQEIDVFYQTLLSRAADPQGRASWVQQLENGVREEQIAFDFLDSPEYLSKGDKYFVDAMYQSLLGRSFDPTGEASWLNALGDDSSGNPTHAATLTHAQVINDFLFSEESLDRLVEGYYEVFLQRQADPGGLKAWVTELQDGLPFLTIGQEFIASDEFYNKAAANK